MVFESKKNVIHFTASDWQYPAITEKQAFLNHLQLESDDSQDLSTNIYLGIPWANHIDDPEITDGRLKKLRELFSDLKKKIDQLRNKSEKEQKKLVFHTVCQHVRWYRLIEFWDYLGIDKIWLSHMTQELDPNLFQPWTLYAVNIESPSRGDGLEVLKAKEKSYLCSFIGAHTEAYRSEIRIQLDEILRSENQKDVLFELNDEWFFQSLVYEKQLKGSSYSLDRNQFERIRRYNHILSHSVFSLCPEGSGPSSIRLWESLAMGVIPVLFENDWVPPKLNGKKWSDFSINISKQDTSRVIDILRSIPGEKVEEMRLACFDVYRQFRLKTCF